MPFTAAHTVAVLPLVNSRRLSATALVFGSMAPDFEYFIRMDVLGIWGHNLRGIFLFDLPMTFALVVLFHKVVKNNLINNLPVFFQKRFVRLKHLSLKQDVFDRPAAFVVCACLGALTHVTWDAFTHQHGYFVQTLSSVYEDSYVFFDGVNYPLWYALQHISTWIGMFILVIYLLLLKPGEGETVKPGVVYWIILAAISAAALWLRFQFPHRPGLDMWAISVISGACAGLIILGFLPGRKNVS
jgi:hypothetical protein